ncbi:hypothetical protein Sya03_44820 [Spirilliplanes yamanashiensis]|uniref:F5/8 type C domain-containing protein n=1 Tax=Spirilliplanes yamanashiensis TaxID=42233 RepID=A0A8J4DLI9_9ACTN|nr:hypothetical protein Sya03_44820 [Spirilliplanes yamanashiensis]
MAGTWHNCSGSENDYVKIDVNNASDSDCIAIPPGNVGHHYYDPTWWVTGANHSATWKRC